MKQIITFLILCVSLASLAQEESKAQLLAIKKANNHVYEGNNLIDEEDFVSGEMAYRKAISEQPSSVAGTYNLANAYIKGGNLEEALFRLQQAVETANSKEEKHKAFHNIGNVLMQKENYKGAVEAYKNSLKNDPTDNETRYNLAVAKKKLKEQEEKNKDQDKNDENKDDKDQKENEDQKDKEGEGDNKDDQKDKEDQENKDGEDKKDEENKPEDDKKDDKKEDGKGDKDKKKDQQKPQPQPGQLSPQQIKNLLEAMNNQEQEVQEKINAEKQKGVKVKTEKDW
ncbi:tetratricopeptide repeat protein [Tamlana sp. 2201CG12-4]|uniref:tetratricopeptide repeat protein n=1 Tax=Tamlana sp. 2201CG12-4 TaxID=3112582 RepID=UPI002DBD5D3D|nr:tetratricopeptide repeat protein [Tamlana sp. 2201CG12-4]MEC3906055.1 tetratricopeptide repeat protein [Tamlana sp. 2201CG12-4]